MVRGADKLCELLSYDRKHTKVSVIPSNEIEILQSSSINERFGLVRNDMYDTEGDITKGATYQVQLGAFMLMCLPNRADIWICPVTLFLLGEYPMYLSVKSMIKPLYDDSNHLNNLRLLAKK